MYFHKGAWPISCSCIFSFIWQIHRGNSANPSCLSGLVWSKNHCNEPALTSPETHHLRSPSKETKESTSLFAFGHRFFSWWRFALMLWAHHAGLLVHWVDSVRVLSPVICSVVLFCVIAGCSAWIQMARVFPPSSQACYSMIYHTSCFWYSCSRCGTHGAVLGCCVLSRSAGQPYRVSVLLAVEWLSHSQLQCFFLLVWITLKFCCGDYEFWVVLSSLWIQISSEEPWIMHASKLWVISRHIWFQQCATFQSQQLNMLYTFWFPTKWPPALCFRLSTGPVQTHTPACPGHPEDHPGERDQCGYSDFPAVPGQTQTGGKRADMCHGHQQHPLGGGDLL